MGMHLRSTGCLQNPVWTSGGPSGRVFVACNVDSERRRKDRTKDGGWRSGAKKSSRHTPPPSPSAIGPSAELCVVELVDDGVALHSHCQAMGTESGWSAEVTFQCSCGVAWPDVGVSCFWLSKENSVHRLGLAIKTAGRRVFVMLDIHTAPTSESMRSEQCG